MRCIKVVFPDPAIPITIMAVARGDSFDLPLLESESEGFWGRGGVEVEDDILAELRGSRSVTVIYLSCSRWSLECLLIVVVNGSNLKMNLSPNFPLFLPPLNHAIHEFPSSHSFYSSSSPNSSINSPTPLVPLIRFPLPFNLFLPSILHQTTQPSNLVSPALTMDTTHTRLL